MLDAQAVTANARGNASALRGLGFLPRDTYIHRPRNILLMRECCWESGMAMNHQLRSKGITAGITTPPGLFEEAGSNAQMVTNRNHLRLPHGGSWP